MAADTVHLTILETFERGRLAALEDVVAELKMLRGGSRGAGVAAAAAGRADEGG